MSNNSFYRTTPEEALKVVEKEISKGHLKIFLGYAPGVGKTYSMLNEANRMLKRGQDIVIGYLESHGRAETNSQVAALEVLPRKEINYNNMILEEIHLDEVLNRNPKIVLIDELAHTNAPGSKNNKRYEDVLEILEHGIDVVSTLNIQHLESLNDVIKQITGITVRETIPDVIVENADEVVVIDITPSALQSRLKRGDIYKNENIARALKNFFRGGNLNALREITLRQTAQEVDDDLEEYMKKHNIRQNWHTAERVMVCVSANPFGKKLIRRGARIAKRYKCEWIVATVNCTHALATTPSKKGLDMLTSHFKLAEQLGAETITLTGKSVSRELVRFASQKHITQIIIGHANRSFWQMVFRGSPVTKVLRHAKDIEIHVIPDNRSF
ncbi:universal stress protein [Clostridium sp. CF012]|uniref:universal stress protein n=1 Tax=Clostridium sp. CF012 TaxID=2843319 RepID=UPI001C0CB460|nr:universal stress protein [Clostridium sp. CF012]MBU3146166.1 universal stress protein [Clostridium sp. CF012]